jgi:hypothetical protein
MRIRMRIREPEIFLTLDPGSGMEKIRIRDKHPGSATLVLCYRATDRVILVNSEFKFNVNEI